MVMMASCCGCERHPVFDREKIQAGRKLEGTLGDASELFTRGSHQGSKNMKMLHRLLRLLRPRRVEADRKPSSLPPAAVDSEEFARLLGSGRVEDLRILARRLSTQPKAHA
jgi:hypothetical protein